MASSAASSGTKRPHSALFPPFSLRAFLRVFVEKEKVILVEELGEVERRRSGDVSGIGVDGFGAGAGGAIGFSRKASAYPQKPGGEIVPPSSLRLLFRIVFVGGQKESLPDR